MYKRQQLIELLADATIETGNSDGVSTPKRESMSLRIKNGVAGWNPEVMSEMPPTELNVNQLKQVPGPALSIEDFIFDHNFSALWTLQQHGIAKGSALILGLAHYHDCLLYTSPSPRD